MHGGTCSSAKAAIGCAPRCWRSLSASREVSSDAQALDALDDLPVEAEDEGFVIRSKLLRAAHGRFGYLLVAVLALIMTAPIVAEGPTGQLFLAIMASSVLVSGLYVAKPTRRSLVIGCALAVTDLGMSTFARYNSSPWILLIQASLWLATLLVVTFVILEVVLASQPVTLETLQAAFCAFLMLGLVWTYAYIILSLIDPDSFTLAESVKMSWTDTVSRRMAFLGHLILSYSTLASVNYQGLVPNSNFANIFCCMEAMMAQIYLAVVIARLVGASAWSGGEGASSERAGGDGHLIA